MEYAVKLRIKISSEDAKKFAIGVYDTVLPFVPFIGMKITIGTWETPEITEITYNKNEDYFYCYSEESECWHDSDFIPMDWLIHARIKDGWDFQDTVFIENKDGETTSSTLGECFCRFKK